MCCISDTKWHKGLQDAKASHSICLINILPRSPSYSCIRLLSHGPPAFTLVGSAVYLPQPNFELESVASFEYALRSTPRSSIISKFTACPETDVWQTGFLGRFSTPSALEELGAGGFRSCIAETFSSTTNTPSHADLSVPCLPTSSLLPGLLYLVDERDADNRQLPRGIRPRNTIHFG